MSKQAKKRKGTQAPSPQEVPLVTEVCSMDDIFPGFLQWQKEREARIHERKQTIRVHPLEQGLFEAWAQAVLRDESKTLPPEMREKGKPVND